ncbi:MAG: DUF1549 domain-containing protein [Planctomycetes bacterium]|nr:DUF1549 domain-containing protein [Planctomycetota bacterium]
MRMGRFLCVGLAVTAIAGGVVWAQEPVHVQIDQFIEAAAGIPVAPLAEDSEFLRRIYLDFAGRIPSSAEAHSFLSDTATGKRSALIDRLLTSPEYARRMRDAWHVQLMERAGEHEEWLKFLEQSFAANKPWDKLVREILNPNPDDESTRGSAYFLTKRLENYGQQPVDLPGLTRDVGRLFMGVDLQCAQCHDHLFVDDYKQVDFQGLHTFLSHATIRTDLKFPAIAEKVVDKKTEFMSVFLKEPRTTGPRLPFGTEVDVPAFAKGEEFAVAPDRKLNFPGKPKFSPLAILSEQLPTASNPQFVRNIVNRLWCQMLGRGLVHPLDLTHSGNPASHPAILELLATEFTAHQFDIRWLLRELALTRAYQRSSTLPAGLAQEPRPESYVVAIEKPLSTEQMFWSILQATGELPRYQPTIQADGKTKPNPAFEGLRKGFLAAFANPPRDPEGDFAPSVKAALFLSNDGKVLELFKPRDGNLADQLLQEANPAKFTDTLFIAVLARSPSSEELKSLTEFLAAHPGQRDKAVEQAIWALISSTEFCVNH